MKSALMACAACAVRAAIAAFFGLLIPSEAPAVDLHFDGVGFSIDFPSATAAVVRRETIVPDHPGLNTNSYQQELAGARFTVITFASGEPRHDDIPSQKADMVAKGIAVKDSSCAGYSEITEFAVAGGQGRQFQQWNCLPPGVQAHNHSELEILPRENRSVRFVAARGRLFFITAAAPGGADPAAGERFLQSFKLTGTGQ